MTLYELTKIYHPFYPFVKLIFKNSKNTSYDWYKYSQLIW